MTEYISRLLSELCGDFIYGSILGLWDNEPDVRDEDELGHHEDDKHVGSNSKLGKNVFHLFIKTKIILYDFSSILSKVCPKFKLSNPYVFAA